MSDDRARPGPRILEGVRDLLSNHRPHRRSRDAVLFGSSPDGNAVPDFANNRRLIYLSRARPTERLAFRSRLIEADPYALTS
jgi:hypothetical protein